jgi:hypothetical protein
MKAVDAGAALLDERLPGWRDEIHPASLDLEQCEQCVLGQLFGEYERGRMLLGLSRSRAMGLGFTRRGTTWERLTAAWREVLR